MNSPRAFDESKTGPERPDEAAIASAFFNQAGELPETATVEYLRTESGRTSGRTGFRRFSIIGEKADCDAVLMQEVIQTLAPIDAAKRPALSGKRLGDIVGSLAALVFLAPVFCIVFLLIWLTDSGPVFYAHERVGKHGRVFRCLKFRTMRRDADEALAMLLQSDPEARRDWDRIRKLKFDPRVSPVGRLLRLSSIDELPQLLNVLAGDMSLVGPRPIVLKECHRYGRYLGRYLAMQPGVTGLWQVSGRNNVSYRRRVAMDVLYSHRASYRLDLLILCKTIPAIAKAEGY